MGTLLTGNTWRRRFFDHDFTSMNGVGASQKWRSARKVEMSPAASIASKTAMSWSPLIVRRKTVAFAPAELVGVEQPGRTREIAPPKRVLDVPS
jgi:hypothetical protein